MIGRQSDAEVERSNQPICCLVERLALARAMNKGSGWHQGRLEDGELCIAVVDPKGFGV